MVSRTAAIPVTLDNGTIVRIEARVLGGEEDVVFHALSFQGVTDAIEGIAATVSGTLQKTKPHNLYFNTTECIFGGWYGGECTCLHSTYRGKGSQRVNLLL